MKTKKTSLIGCALLTLTAMIWGFAFVAQKAAMDYMTPAACNCTRFFVGGLFLLLFLSIRGRIRGGRQMFRWSGRWFVPDLTRRELWGGALCGLFLAAASTLQQYGIVEGDVGTASFITALYIVIVPLLGIFMKRRAGLAVWIGIAVALIGTYLLAIVGGNASAEEIRSFSDLYRAVLSAEFKISRAHILILICAVAFSFHIVTVDRVAVGCDGVRLSMVQFFTAGIIGVPFMMITGGISSIPGVFRGILPVLFLGIFSCGVAYTLQIIGQSKTEPAIASVIMSLESVFGAIGGALILKERMNPAELIGCCIVFIAVLMAQLGDRNQDQAP